MSAIAEETYPALSELLSAAEKDGMNESDCEAIALEMQKYYTSGLPSTTVTEDIQSIKLPDHIFEVLVDTSESYLIVARRRMSKAAIEIDPLSLVACDPFESSGMSSAQILLDALPPSFRKECIDTSKLPMQAKQKQVSMVMSRLECYYARMCATEILSMSQQILQSSSLAMFSDDQHESESNRIFEGCKFESSFKSFLRSIPIEHAPEDRSMRSSSTAYVRVKSNLSSLVQCELRRLQT